MIASISGEKSKKANRRCDGAVVRSSKGSKSCGMSAAAPSPSSGAAIGGFSKKSIDCREPGRFAAGDRRGTRKAKRKNDKHGGEDKKDKTPKKQTNKQTNKKINKAENCATNTQPNRKQFSPPAPPNNVLCICKK